MPIAVPTNAGTNAVDATAQTAITRHPTETILVGDILVVAVDFGLASTPGAGVLTVADDASNVYALLAQADKTTNNTSHTWVFATVVAHQLTVANTVTAGLSAGSFNFPIIALVHCSLTGFVWNPSQPDQQAASIGQSISPSSGNTTTTGTPDDLLLGFIGTANPQPVTWGGGFTGVSNQADSTRRLDVGYQIVSATGAYAASGTITSADWSAVITALRTNAVASTAQLVPSLLGRMHL